MRFEGNEERVTSRYGDWKIVSLTMVKPTNQPIDRSVNQSIGQSENDKSR